MSLSLFVENHLYIADANPNVKWYGRMMRVLNSSQDDERFYYMCSTLDLLNINVLKRVLLEIKQIEAGILDSGSAGSDAWNVLFDKNKADFEFDYAPEGEEIGGEVSLAQFKLAVQTYLQFLEDPERKPIKVPFPEQ